MDRLGYLELFQ